MIHKYVKGTVYVFIDASNIYHSFKKLGWKIDFLRLKNYLESNLQLGEMFYYSAYDPDYSKQRKFLDFLEIIGYIVRKKKVKFIILFSGDSDFEALLKYMKAYRKNCIVVSTKDHVSIELLKQAKFIDLKKLRSEIELKG